MPRSHPPSLAPSGPPEAAWLGRWFTAARRQGFLALLPPEAWHTLSAILSFTSRDGWRVFTVDQLALALALPRSAAEARLQQLAEIRWHEAPLAVMERDASGEIAGVTLAPVEALARIEPRDDHRVSGTEAGDSGNPRPTSDPQLVASLQATGLNPTQIDWLTQRFDAERIQRQLDWLPSRRAHNPAAMLLRAIEQDWGPPGEAA